MTAKRAKAKLSTGSGAGETRVLPIRGRGGGRLDEVQRSITERVALGKAARAQAPRSSHAAWARTPETADPITLLEQQAESRVVELVPIRYGRMLVSPVTYYRGAALPMAADLAATPTSGFEVQLCGDAHLSNFGIFGSPERHLFFDVNDFDETAPGPWEWDVKRLAASLEVGGRANEFSEKQLRTIVRSSVASYRKTMSELAGMAMLDVWYAHLDMDELLPKFRSLLDSKRTPSVWAAITKARAHDSHQAFDKLCRVVNDEPRIKSDPPLVVPVEDFVAEADLPGTFDNLNSVIQSYAQTLEPDRRRLLDGYRFVHLARKVVGVGSVGTEAWIALFLGRDRGSPLLLQVKEAQRSVLEQFTRPSAFENHGERVVAGQRMIQAASDIFLGWERAHWQGEPQRDFYVRQLRDWKGSADVAGMTPAGMNLWGQMCGWTLARAHARSGDRIAIASYLGRSDAIDRAMSEFAVTYTDQIERDHHQLREAVTTGRLDATIGL